MLAVALPLALVAACGSAAESTTTDGESKSEVVSGENSSASSAPAAANAVVLKLEGSGFTQFPKDEYGGPASVSYAAVISNQGSEIATNVQIQVGLLDKGGSVVDSEEHSLAAVLPGTSVAISGGAYDADGVTKLSVKILPGQSEKPTGAAGNFTVSKVATKTVEYGGLKTTAVVASPFTKDLKDVEAVAVYRDAKGDIIGGDVTFVNFIPAKGTATVSIDNLTWKKKPAKTDVYVAISSLSLLS